MKVGKIVGWTVVGLILIVALFSTCYSVTDGTKGVVFTFSKITNVAEPGLHFKIPFIQSVEKITVRQLLATADVVASSSDLQKVTTKVSANYYYNPDKLKQIYKRTGFDVTSLVVDPRISEVVKATTAKYKAEDLIKRREEVKQEIKAELVKTLAPYDLVCGDIQITDFDFSDDFNSAIEAKQVSEQKTLKARNDLERIKVEKEQRIATAQGEAEAIRIQAEAVRSQGGREYVNLKWIEAWQAGGSKVPTYMGGGQGMMPLPIMNMTK